MCLAQGHSITAAAPQLETEPGMPVYKSPTLTATADSLCFNGINILIYTAILLYISVGLNPIIWYMFVFFSGYERYSAVFICKEVPLVEGYQTR